MSHDAMSGSSGFDLYVNNRYRATFMPPYDMKDGYESLVDLKTEETREILIHFPTYSEVSELYIGLKEGCTLKAAPDYKVNVPIVFYGSSITQGACSSRSGMAYESIISRRFDADHINLGFAGRAKGEQVMAEYIAGLDMSLFVYDYDHNASIELYRETHERFYKTIREKNPELPIIIMTRPRHEKQLQPSEWERIEIARETYENAKARGELVYFIPGYELMALAGTDGVVDGCHPSDLGFFSMAQRLSVELEKILNK
jgi:hypothetical protein